MKKINGCSNTLHLKVLLNKVRRANEGSDLTAAGELAPFAASVLMKIMYAARMARFDLLRPVQQMARFMTKWTRQQDMELHRLVCYIHSTNELENGGLDRS